MWKKHNAYAAMDFQELAHVARQKGIVISPTTRSLRAVVVDPQSDAA
jgi:hypothetical protein